MNPVRLPRADRLREAPICLTLTHQAFTTTDQHRFRDSVASIEIAPTMHYPFLPPITPTPPPPIGPHSP